MLCSLEHARGGTMLHHLTPAHHRQRVGQAANHGQIVADENIGEAELRAQLLQQRQDLRLHRHVERVVLSHTTISGRISSAVAIDTR